MKNAKRVCIVGFAGGFDKVPWKESGWEIWGFNQMYRSLWPSTTFPFTRWFELHTPDYFGRTARGEKDTHDTWKRIASELVLLSQGADGMLARWPKLLRRKENADAARALIGYRNDKRWRIVPVYLPKPDRLVPKATIYPRAKVEALTPHGKYHAGSFDWLVALAILERFTHIRITGVDFALGGEPISARPCLEYWLGVAEGRGITTEVLGGDCFRIFHLARHDRQYGFQPFKLVEDE